MHFNKKGVDDMTGFYTRNMICSALIDNAFEKQGAYCI